MKARVPVSKKVKEEMLKQAKMLVQDTMDEQKEQIVRRVLKLVCYVMHAHNGWGHKRCSRLVNQVDELVKEADEDSLFWEHLDRVVVDYLNLGFEREEEKL